MSIEQERPAALKDLPLMAKDSRPIEARSLAGAGLGRAVAGESPALPAASFAARPHISLTRKATNPLSPTEAKGATATNPATLPGEVFGPGSAHCDSEDVGGGARWSLVLLIRDEVTSRWQRDNPSRVLDAERDRRRISELIEEQLIEQNKRASLEGRPALGYAARKALEQSVLAGIFGAGRFQVFLDMPGVENIEIEGFDRITIQYADGTVGPYPTPWSSDEELIGDVQHLARTSVTGERQFSVTHKALRMTLPDGSRLAAEAWFTSRPSVTIRRHRFVDTDLAQSLRLGLIDHGIKAFNEASFRAGKNVIIAGDPAAGKTTYARALINSLDPDVRIATIETMFELGVHTLHHRHRRVWAAEAQDGGEIGADGRPIARVDLTTLVQLALQKNAQRIIVGEVTGPEIVAMFNAMQGGRGSLSTLHASCAEDAIDRMVNLVMQAQANMTARAAYNLVATHIDYIVHIAYVNEGPIGGGSYRYVDEIIELHPSKDDAVPYVIEHLWRPGPDGRATPTGVEPNAMRELQRWGLTREVFTAGACTWPQPLRLKVPHRQVS